MESTMSELLLQATPELLDGWRGPAAYCDGSSCVVVESPTNAGQPFPTTLVWDRPSGRHPKGVTRWGRTENVYLDLARAECRDRVARVIAEHHFGGIDDLLMTTAPRWFCRWLHTEPTWDIEAEAIEHEADGKRSGTSSEQAFILPNLDPTDDTRLPDGSRLVDARALLAVAREVLSIARHLQMVEDREGTVLQRQIVSMGVTEEQVDRYRHARGFCPVADLDLPHQETFLQWLLRNATKIRAAR